MLSRIRKPGFRIALVSAALVGIVLAAAGSVMAQCVMCRASLGSNSSFIKNFNIGVLVLLVPPVVMFCTIFIIAFKRRNSG